MAEIVPVHGKWHGGRAWRRVVPLLRSFGHEVHSPTLTGLWERAHPADSGINPDFRVRDVLGVIRFNELADVVLAGHSYGGIEITGSSSEIPERIRSLVNLDAVVPSRSEQAALDIGLAERQRESLDSARGGFLAPSSGEHLWTADPEALVWLSGLVTPHPIRCITEVPTLSGRQEEMRNRLFALSAANKPSPFWQLYEGFRSDSSCRTELWTAFTMPWSTPQTTSHD